MFGAQELATAAQYGVNVVTALFNNNAFGNVLRDQRLGFGNRVIGAALENRDFMLRAKAFGVEACRMAAPAALAPALDRALKSEKPVLIEVALAQGDEVSPWAFIHPTR